MKRKKILLSIPKNNSLVLTVHQGKNLGYQRRMSNLNPPALKSDQEEEKEDLPLIEYRAKIIDCMIQSIIVWEISK